jgi:mannose-6-phosphate isomerase-like protein (cupin superfamily)
MDSVALADALRSLPRDGTPFAVICSDPRIEVEIYRPIVVDLQTPHDRDEIYFVGSGQGWFTCAGSRRRFSAGDMLWVRRGEDHRFFDFSEDFATWVIFLAN